jgi:hypothetical protein
MVYYNYKTDTRCIMKSQQHEKRGFIRVPFHTAVEVQVPGRTIRSRDEINISMSGIRVTMSDEAPPVETECQVRVILGTAEKQVIINANGRTIRSQPGTLAVEFLDLDLDSYQHLQQLIVNNADDPVRAEEEFAAHWGIRKSQH